MMSGGSQRLAVILSLVDNFSGNMRQAGASLENFRTTARRTAFALGAIGGTGAVIFSRFLNAARTQGQAIALLDNRLRAMDTTWVENRAQIDRTIQATQRLTDFGYVDQLTVLRQLINATNNFDLSLRILPTAAGLAARAGIPLEQAASLIVKALQGDEGAIQALRELGVVFKTPLPRDIILGVEEFNEKVPVARDAASRFAAAIKDMNLAFVEGPQGGGALGLALGTLAGFLERLVPVIKAIPAPLREFSVLFVGIGSAAAIGAAAVALLVAQLGGLAVVLTFLPAFLAVTAAITAAIVIWQNWDAVVQFVTDHWKQFVGFVSLFLPALHPITAAIEFAVNVWRGWGAIVQWVKDRLDEIKNVGLIRVLLDVFVPEWLQRLARWVAEGVTIAVNFATDNLTPPPLPGAAGRGAGIIEQTSPIGGILGALRGLIPGFAAGGIVRQPTLGLVAESGPEAIIPLDRSGFMGTTIINNIDSHGDIDFERRVAQTLARIIRGGNIGGFGGGRGLMS